MAKSTFYEPLSPELEKSLETLTRYHREQFQMLQDHDRAQARDNRKAPTLNFDKLFIDLARGNLAGENREALQEAAKRDGVVWDPVRPYCSFRDLTVASGPSAGFLKSTEVQDSVDILRPWSVMARAGIQIEFGLIGDAVVPKVSAKSTPAWLSTESTQAAPSQPTLSQIAITPKDVAGFLQYSRQFSKQTNASQFASRELLRTVGTAIDQAIINGSGTNGQPTGIINTAGVQTQSGTTLNSGVTVMQQKSAEANVVDEQIKFLSTPAVRQLLRIREIVAASGRFVWDRDLVADRPAYISTDMPPSTMICADFSLVYLGFWGSGLYLELNPFDQSGFKAGIIQARVLTSCDTAVRHPLAFVVASSIT
jgi:HK97 family phage major capsid protein